MAFILSCASVVVVATTAASGNSLNRQANNTRQGFSVVYAMLAWSSQDTSVLIFVGCACSEMVCAEPHTKVQGCKGSGQDSKPLFVSIAGTSIMHKMVAEESPFLVKDCQIGCGFFVSAP
jgi:hypothetical protein